jgi:hypothetical protein
MGSWKNVEARAVSCLFLMSGEGEALTRLPPEKSFSTERQGEEAQRLSWQ